MDKGVAMLIRNAEGKVLLQMRDGNAPIMALQWALWCGGFEPEDGDMAEACAARECQEELAIEVDKTEFENIYTNVKDDFTQYVCVLKRSIEWGDFRVLEGAGAGFFTLEEMKQLPMHPMHHEFINWMEAQGL
jgi:8-oxo-dGTP pyrophosphatase MutT (NUDIX family)